eukprot:5736981-Prymnesium_polylepis.2
MHVACCMGHGISTWTWFGGRKPGAPSALAPLAAGHAMPARARRESREEWSHRRLQIIAAPLLTCKLHTNNATHGIFLASEVLL